MHPLSLAAGADDARPAKISKMARNLRLALPEHLDQVADAKLSPGQQVKKTEARSIGECGEKRHEELGFSRQGFWRAYHDI